MRFDKLNANGGLTSSVPAPFALSLSKRPPLSLSKRTHGTVHSQFKSPPSDVDVQPMPAPVPALIVINCTNCATLPLELHQAQSAA